MQQSNSVSDPDEATDLEARLARVRARTLAGLADRARELRAAADRLASGDEAAREAIRRLAHKLRGVAGSAGRPDLTERAARLETAVTRASSALAVAEGARRLAAAAEGDGPASGEVAASRARPTAARRRQLGWRVVAIDDEASTRRLLDITFRQAGGCDVETFEAPGEAMRRMRGAPPDLVVVDAMMPQVNGLELYRGVRRQLGAVPVVILSAASAEELGWELPDDPRLRWMRKPFRPGALIDAVRAFVEGG